MLPAGLRGLTPARAALFAQLWRFGVTGLFVTALGAGAYWLLATPWRWPPSLAAVAGYLVAAGTGYVLHSRFSFRGHGGERTAGTTGRFLLVSLLSLLLNELWVWLLVTRAGGPTWWPIPLMLFVTPAVTFTLQRRWVFA